MKLKWLYVIILTILLYDSFFNMKRTEIEEVDVVRVLGIDKVGEDYVLSALFNEKGGADTAAGGVNVIEAQGKTVYQAYENLKLKNKKTLTLAHTSYFLLGDMAARSGLDVCMDFISHDETIKIDSYLLVLKDGRVTDLLKGTLEKELFIHEDLSTITEKQMNRIQKNTNTVVRILNELENQNSSVLVPYLREDGEFLYMDGYAVFDQSKLYDYLDYETSVAIDFLHDNIRSYPIYLGDTVGLVIFNANTKLKSRIEQNKVVVDVNLKYETNMKEITTKENIFTWNKLKNITEEQNDYMEHLLQKPIDYSRKNKLDVVGVSKILKIQHYKQWEDLEPQWKNTVEKMQFDIHLNSKTARNYIIRSLR